MDFYTRVFALAAALIGVLGGVGAFGAIGVFLGPVVVALAVALIRFGEETVQEPLSPAP